MQRGRHGRETPSRNADGRTTGRAKQRAFAIGALQEGDDLSELRELLLTAGVATVGQAVQHREQPHPNTYLGPGKLEEVKAQAKQADANLIAVDDELSPRQGRNLEEQIGIPVIDRTAIILDIFAGHAQSAEGKLQVELAQLEYNLARMRGLWTHLERLGAGEQRLELLDLARPEVEVRVRLVAPLDQLADDGDAGGAQQLLELFEIALGQRADDVRALLRALCLRPPGGP